jgi:hypothetical protein
MDPAAAQTLALKALAWAAGDPDLLGEFLNLSGMDVGELRARAADPEFLAAFMDFLLAADKPIQDFCAEEGIRPETLHAVRRALPGAAPE